MTIVKKYPSRILAIKCQIEGVYTLELESLGKQFKYEPGQFLHLAIDEYDPSGPWPESRCFSMQSNPTESTIRITYAVKGRFTKQMEQQLRVGSDVWLKLPYGDLFTTPHNQTNTVFIAGGTGITPFLSLFTHESFKEYVNPSIFIGFRTKRHNIYKEELDRSYNSSKFVKSFYEDINGIIDINSIYLKNGITNDYFISGPPSMIKLFKSFLIKNGTSQNQIKTDDWE